MKGFRKANSGSKHISRGALSATLVSSTPLALAVFRER